MKNFIKLFGVRIDKVTLTEATEKVSNFLKDSSTNTIYTPNSEIVMLAKEDETLKTIINKADLIIPDGIGIVYASRMKKKPLPERVTGVDLSMKILELCNENGYSLFILGGKEGVAKKACEKISDEYKTIKIAGFNSGYFKGTHIGFKGHLEEKAVIDKINSSKADVLFVGLGAPKQEIWINENKDKLNCKVIIGNGGTVDIIAGEVKRAPIIYQKLGLEWLHRLIKEPYRIKRQLVLPKFALKVLFSRKDIIE